MNEEERCRILQAGFDKFKQAADTSIPSPESPFNELIGKLILLQQEVKEHIKPIIAAGGGKDPRALEVTIYKLFAHAFSKFSKQELEEIAAWMLTSTAMEGIYPTKLGVQPHV